MESHFPFSLNITTSLIITFFLFLLLIQISKTLIFSSSRAQTKLPPGPWKLPVIGNLLHVAFAGSLPHHALRVLAKKYGPIFHLQLGEISAVVISSPRLVKEAHTTHDLALANRPQILVGKVIFYNCVDIAFSPYGTYWKQMRKIGTTEIFSAKKVRSFRSLREHEVSRFIESIHSTVGSPINLSKRIYSLLYVIVFRATLGNKYEDQDALINIIKDTIACTGGFNLADLFPSSKLLYVLTGMRSKLKKTHQKLDKILDDIIDGHKVMDSGVSISTGSEEDLLDVLFRLKESRELEVPITSSNMKALIMDIFTGATDTSSSTIEWAMTELIRNPRVMEKAQAELRQFLKGKKTINESDIQDFSYLKQVIKETLRLHSPVPLVFPRQCRKEFEIEGYTIPVNTHVIINFSAIARDPEYWHDPESFFPERFENTSIDFHGTNFEFIPFGTGRRICPGIAYGMANIEFILAQLLYHFDWKLPNGMKPEDLDMSESFAASVSRKNNLYLVSTHPCTPL